MVLAVGVGVGLGSLSLLSGRMRPCFESGNGDLFGWGMVVVVEGYDSDSDGDGDGDGVLSWMGREKGEKEVWG